MDRLNMINKIKGEKMYCGLDIGCKTIKACLVKYPDNQPAELLGVYESKTVGVKDASVGDINELSECIHATIDGLGQKTGIKFREIQLGIGGELIVKRFSSSVIPLLDKGSKIIAFNDIKRVQSQARLLGMNMEEEILHDIPQYYKVDDVNTSLNPLGLFGRKLEVKSLLILSNMTLIKNITKAVNQAGYEVANLFLTSFVSSEVALDNKLKKDGCALIDVGSHVTDILIFKDGMLKYLDTIVFGGDDFTHTIASHLNLTFDVAEELKKSYAVALKSDVKDDEEILIKKEAGYVPIRREFICQAIEPVIVQLVNNIQESLKASNLAGELSAGCVMVGGGSLLPGLLERIEESTNLPVKMGKINLSSKSLNNAVMYSSVVGLAQEGYNRSLSFAFPLNGQDTTWNRLVSRIKEVYQEYF